MKRVKVWLWERRYALVMGWALSHVLWPHEDGLLRGRWPWVLMALLALTLMLLRAVAPSSEGGK